MLSACALRVTTRQIGRLTSLHTGMSSSASQFPHFAYGEVVKGFGRGSKELGIPTGEFIQFSEKEVYDVPRLVR